MDWNQIVKPIMAGLKKHEPFPWPRTDAGRLKIIGTLQELLPNDDIPKTCLGLSNEAMNRRLRELISPYLKSSDQELTAQLAIWIVKQWGGIHRGTNSIPKWCRDLSGFNHKAVASFVSQIGIARISSWSKIIAFAEPTTYAIYDARTTIAINCRLHDIGYREGFFMPTGRNTHVEPAARLLKQTNFKEVFGYRNYLDLIGEISREDAYADILGVEMDLFTNAPLIASTFVTKTQTISFASR